MTIRLLVVFVTIVLGACSASRDPIPVDAGDDASIVCNVCPAWCPDCVIDPIDCALSNCAPFDGGGS